MKAKEIQDLIDFISKSGLEEVNIETEEFKIKVKRNSDAPRMVEHMPAAPAPVAAAPAPAAAAPAAPAPKSGNDESKYLTIKSPMIGTFYRSPNPETDVFVKVGDKVKSGQPVCIIEAMKLFNEIESEVS
ncbi:MAG: acetyl-CoA carboxylase biotin carboxyl carrier protein, partial [Imperialibacter sp.]